MAGSGSNYNSEYKGAGPGPATPSYAMGLFGVSPPTPVGVQGHPKGKLFTALSPLECRHMASQLGLTIASNQAIDYSKCWDFYTNPKNREPNLDAKTVPSWKDIHKDPLTNFRIQALYSTLLFNYEKIDQDLDPLLNATYLLMDSTGPGLCAHDPDLSDFGNQLNRNYCLYTYAMALYGVRTACRDIINSDAQKLEYGNLHLPAFHDGRPKDRASTKKQVIYTNLNSNIRNQKFTIYNYTALGNSSIEVTLEEVNNQILVNQKNSELKENEKPITLTPEGKFPADVKLSENEIKQLQTATTFEGLDVNARNIAIAQIAKRKALEHAETLNLLTEATSLRMTQEVFTHALSCSPWGNYLTPYADKLFHLSTGLGDMTTLSLLKYIQLIGWLGEPSLTPDQTIPAPIALNLYFQFLTQNRLAETLFKGLYSRDEINQLSEEKKKSLGRVLRFNDGHLSFDEKNEPKFFHRNLVLTNYEDTENHKLIFSFDAKTRTVDRNKDSVSRYVRRNTPRSRPSELDIAFRQIVEAFNTLRWKKEDLTPKNSFDTIAALTTLACLQDNINNKKLPSGRQSPWAFDPKRGIGLKNGC